MIAIVDYGMGNLRSVQKALERVGHAATITSAPSVVARAERVVLPGVGASADALAAVRAAGLEDAIRGTIDEGKPFLGVCLGLQMLFDVSYEDGEHRGLGVLPGKVVRFAPPAPATGPPLKVPHMGWNTVSLASPAPLFDGIADQTHFYFVHAYHVVPDDPAVVAGWTDYGGPFCSAVTRGNLFATQFHPEKSQRDGLRLLRNFAELPA